MESVARRLEFEGVEQEVGRVLETKGAELRVRTRTGDYRAKRAVSCLVEPLVDDTVILGLTPHAAYVLAVLEREERVRTTIALDGDLEVKLANGRFVVGAQEGVDLLSAKDVTVAARGINVNAVEGNVVVQQLSVLGSFVRAEFEKVKVFAGTIDSVLERFSQRVKRSYREVQEFDQVRAERIDYSAKSTMSLHAQNALVTAETLVKVDGEQIHLG